MIENNLLKTNFTGKDGFRWWIGQVAPEDAQGSQIQEIGEAWGTRVKVRIFGYHPPDETELANDDLPWAQVLLSPQCGSGKANRGKSLRVSPGDTVMGFFLDGDDAQLPVVMGLFAKSGNPAFGGNEEYTYPFQPFTGYTSKIKASDYMIKGEGGASDGKFSQRSGRNVSTNTAKKIQDGRKDGLPERSTSAANGKQINFGGSNENRVEKINGQIENAVNDVANASSKDKFRIIDNTARKITGIAQSLSGSFVNKTFADLKPKLNQGLHDLYKKTYALVLLATQNPSIAKKAGTAAQTAMVGPVRSLQNFIPCAVKNISENLFGSVRNILTSLLDNVENFVTCIGDQFIGALFNDIIGNINKQLGGLMKGVSKIFKGDLVSMLRSSAEGMLGISSAFNCELPSAVDGLGAKTNNWVMGKGPKDIVGATAEAILSVANAAQELQEAAESPGGILGNLGIFDFMRPDVSTPGFSSQLSDCYTGPPLNCAGIKINIFGGGGEGASAMPILGSIVGDTFATQTASLIGIKLTNGGGSYVTPPFVEIVDNCNQGYGAVARAVIDYDPNSPTYQQVVDVYIVTGGENYPVIEPVDGIDAVYTVDHVVVVDSGQDYTNNDTVTDEQGNEYTMILDDGGRIINVIPPNPEITNVKEVKDLPELTVTSSTGFGAVLKAQIGARPEFQGEIKQVIDCITPRDGIVGFVNGEPYYGAFHVMPNGTRMTGAKHSDNDFIIYDTPQASRTSTARSSTSTTQTTPIVTSPPISYTTPTETNVSNTTTPSQTTTSSSPQTGTTDTPSQQTSGQSDPPSSNNSSGGNGSSGSGGGYSGY